VVFRRVDRLYITFSDVKLLGGFPLEEEEEGE